LATVTGKAIDLPILRRIFSYTRPYRFAFYTSVFLTLVVAFLSPVRPVLVQYTVDHFIMKGDGAGLLRMTMLMVALVLVQSLLQYYHTYLTNSLGLAVVKDLRVKLYRHILNFRLKFFDNTPIGILITRTVSDLENISEIFSEGLIVIIGDLLTLFIIVAFMFYIDWRLALISLSTIPILLVATRIFQQGIKGAFREVRTQVAHLNTFVQEHITGMSVVQIFNRQPEEMHKFMKINKLHAKAHIKSVWYYSIFFPVVELLSAASLGLLVWYGARGVIGESVSMGNVLAFIMYITMVFRPIRELADKFNTLQMGMVSSERVFKVMDTDEVIENRGTVIAKDISGEVEFKNVWFTYAGAKEEGRSKNGEPSLSPSATHAPNYILKDISFKVKAGQSLALVGATGAGKSSVINLVNRFYEYNQGEILIDGINIRNYELYSLRNNIAVVLQDVFLFSDSIANNISLGDKSITRDHIVEAAHAVGAHRFIEKLPGTYDFNVMERGGMLSVGQRQLISFIRAYVFNPKILILDEATSSIDTESEELIQEATKKLTEHRTSIIIAHRLSTIQNADKIIVLDHGEIKEQGSHQELLKQKGIYKKLYEIQFAISGSAENSN
jgi:ATP-binding cassette, subfamily B, multidrug efflux pump